MPVWWKHQEAGMWWSELRSVEGRTRLLLVVVVMVLLLLLCWWRRSSRADLECGQRGNAALTGASGESRRPAYNAAAAEACSGALYRISALSVLRSVGSSTLEKVGEGDVGCDRRRGRPGKCVVVGIGVMATEAAMRPSWWDLMCWQPVKFQVAADLGSTHIHPRSSFGAMVIALRFPGRVGGREVVVLSI